MSATDYTPLWYWVREREQLRVRKQIGQEPWTEDPILSTYRFCNVRREDDIGTIWIREHIREPFAEHPLLWLMLCIGRQINWPDTLAEMIGRGMWPSSDDFHPRDLVQAAYGNLRRRFMTMGPTSYYVDLTRFISQKKGLGYHFKSATNTIRWGGMDELRFTRGDGHPHSLELAREYARGELIWDHAVPLGDVVRATTGLTPIPDAQRQLMRHALGVDLAQRPYRNRYISRGRMADWEALIERGYAIRAPFDTKTDQILYAVTDEGIAALGIALLPDDLEPSERYHAKERA